MVGECIAIDAGSNSVRQCQNCAVLECQARFVDSIEMRFAWEELRQSHDDLASLWLQTNEPCIEHSMCGWSEHERILDLISTMMRQGPYVRGFKQTREPGRLPCRCFPSGHDTTMCEVFERTVTESGVPANAVHQ